MKSLLYLLLLSSTLQVLAVENICYKAVVNTLSYKDFGSVFSSEILIKAYSFSPKFDVATGVKSFTSLDPKEEYKLSTEKKVEITRNFQGRAESIKMGDTQIDLIWDGLECIPKVISQKGKQDISFENCSQIVPIVKENIVNELFGGGMKALRNQMVCRDTPYLHNEEEEKLCKVNDPIIAETITSLNRIEAIDTKEKSPEEKLALVINRYEDCMVAFGETVPNNFSDKLRIDYSKALDKYKAKTKSNTEKSPKVISE